MKRLDRMDRPGRQAGVGMIEVLVAMLVISLGLLGLAGLQAAGLKNNHGAFLRSQAAIFASDMTDRMRANRSVARAGGYTLAMSASAPGGTTVADVDRQQWLADLATLPGGDGSIGIAADVVTIAVRWNEASRGNTTVDPNCPVAQPAGYVCMVMQTRL